jgi:hypothetical protein
MKQQTEKYMGIADCHGIESFRPYVEKDFGFLVLRASLNRQRHACPYVVELDKTTKGIVDLYLKKGLYKKGLYALKESTEDISFPTRDMENYIQSWELIPNPKLDPFHVEEITP